MNAELQPNEFLCWMEDWNEESDAEKIKAYDMQTAAELYADKMHPYRDYFNEAVISVKNFRGTITKFDVEVIAVPEFHAKEVWTRMPKKKKEKA
jgi:NAD(P)H-dependent FMN reductase